MSLEDIRKDINQIDDEIITLLKKRMQCVHKVGLIKQNEKSPIYRPTREMQIINRLSLQEDEFLKKEAISSIYQEIFSISRNLERHQRVAFLGPSGTYTHQAASSWFGNLCTYVELASINDVFTALKNDEVDYSVVPIENNTEGVVGNTLDNLALHKDIFIFAEKYLDIHHSFASNCYSLSDIKCIYSHPQAYNQCLNFIASHNLQNAEFIATKSTSQAALFASKNENSAAICSKIAAKLANIPLMFEKIEDNLSNKTRFLILSKHKAEYSNNSKTSIIANTSHKPGALVELLNEFKNANINLTQIQSRPLKTDKFEYSFFIDFDGHEDDLVVKNIINKKNIRILGSYIKCEV
ncbi:prephenate dehydratase [Campylobacter canadensis]|uniref:Bifunctional chorismate mutase/prephenate dehydratase n=1 Tax=Campylobacter canadensis TaxID=449520 RepID=A0ABS7WPR7_9BACT|nr:prephenate dehydratase [Campylobacter canadensis]MBZ7986763.1 prephenate dehydratase [Campylobacter canadensis]MBZ7994548.1 prephenate dehydratase [Campylobacter canadensis]MBZ7997095.1 prephenate dehydratase [Campylobacter canadensis]MBZ7997800.1 prephenate dehydratase [Campylobacter canadensis]MBZ7999879.1 prephenate dehydratase [Campylobacter canadensis]